MKDFWQKIKKYKLFIVLAFIVVLLITLKLKTNNGETGKINTITQTNKTDNVITKIETPTVIETPTPTIKKLSDEEISNLSYDDYVKYADSLSLEDEQKMPPLASDMSESFPYEEETFLAEKYENLKVYAKSKIADKAEAERNLKYWYFIEIGDTLPSEQIVWE